jgi:four helix bundle protein
MELVVSVYDVTKRFPKEELHGLTSQLRRAAVSIPSNVAEGQARNSRGEFVQFLGQARGALAEVHTRLEIAERLGHLRDDELDKVAALIDETGRILNGLVAALRKTSH